MLYSKYFRPSKAGWLRNSPSRIEHGTSSGQEGQYRLAGTGWLKVLLSVCLFLISACSEQTQYEQLIEAGISSGETYNDLFLGYELGMPKQAFYDLSWELNRQGQAMQGPKNQTVQYELKDELPHPAKMFFYPDFYNEKIFQMRVRFIYDGWAPWNKNLSADSLQLDVVELFREWYGNGFIEHGATQDIFGQHVQYVKVDGNRGILVAKEGDREVIAIFTDLVAERETETEK